MDKGFYILKGNGVAVDACRVRRKFRRKKKDLLTGKEVLYAALYPWGGRDTFTGSFPERCFAQKPGFRKHRSWTLDEHPRDGSGRAPRTCCWAQPTYPCPSRSDRSCA